MCVWIWEVSARPAAEQARFRTLGAVSASVAVRQVFTMERLREITTERLRMMQEVLHRAESRESREHWGWMGGRAAEGGASAFAVNSWAGGVPAPPQQGLGLSPEELLGRDSETLRGCRRFSVPAAEASDGADCLEGVAVALAKICKGS